VKIIDKEGNTPNRPVHESELSPDAAEKGEFKHFMLKEIHEQPRGVAQTLEERVAGGKLLEAAFGPKATDVFRRTKSVHIVACGTSYHAGVVARYFIEQLCKLPCTVEVASEYRYRNPVVPTDALFVTISQSGETADTLAALRLAKQAGYLSSLSICNVPESSLPSWSCSRAPDRKSGLLRQRPSRRSLRHSECWWWPWRSIMALMRSGNAAWCSG
jgi:glucosamine--fructose-6-phosphate aminotransferase (isomerizing)